MQLHIYSTLEERDTNNKQQSSNTQLLLTLLILFNQKLLVVCALLVLAGPAMIQILKFKKEETDILTYKGQKRKSKWLNIIEATSLLKSLMSACNLSFSLFKCDRTQKYSVLIPIFRPFELFYTSFEHIILYFMV